jgi:hypothetical protein
VIAADRLGDPGEHVLDMLGLGAEAGDMPALIEIDLVAVLDDVFAGLLPTIGRLKPLGFDRQGIAGVINLERLIEQPVQMHAIAAVHDYRRCGQAGLIDAGASLFDGDMIDVGPERTHCPNLPRQIEPACCRRGGRRRRRC